MPFAPVRTGGGGLCGGAARSDRPKDPTEGAGVSADPFARLTMSRSALLLSLALALGSVALVACETDTRRDVEADGDVDTDVEVGINDDVESEAQEAASEAARGLEAAGEDIRNAADQAGEKIQEAAEDVHDAIDSNVDLGDNAENQ